MNLDKGLLVRKKYIVLFLSINLGSKFKMEGEWIGAKFKN